MDRGFWISWYDLPSGDSERYVAWLHGSYMPKILSKPGVQWGAHFKTVQTAPGGHMHRTKDPAVPNGGDYLLIFGGDSTATFTKGREAFLENAPARLDRDLTADDKAM